MHLLYPQFLSKPHDGKDAINRDILQTVRQTFIDADDDGSGKLGPDEFVSAFTGEYEYLNTYFQLWEI